MADHFESIRSETVEGSTGTWTDYHDNAPFDVTTDDVRYKVTRSRKQLAPKLTAAERGQSVVQPFVPPKDGRSGTFSPQCTLTREEYYRLMARLHPDKFGDDQHDDPTTSPAIQRRPP